MKTFTSGAAKGAANGKPVEAQAPSNGDGRHEEPHEAGALARWQPWNRRSKELAVHFEKHWVIRTDCFGQYYTDRAGNVCQTTEKEVPLTLGILLRHCCARKTEEVIGLHTTGFLWVEGVPRGGVSVCVLLCIDIDHHGDGPAPEANLAAALAWYQALIGLGFHPLLIDSNGRGGYRLYVIFDQQILAKHARQLGRWLVRDWADYGLAECPEVFPKQDEIGPPGGSTPFGNWLRLPGRHHKRDHWSTAWDGSEFVGGDDAIDAILNCTGDSPQLIPSEALEFERDRKGERAEREARPRTDVELEENATLAKEALGWIGPGKKDRQGREFVSDYDHWLKIGFALHELGDVGFRLWADWSSQCDAKFDEDVCIKKWATMSDEGPDRVRLGTLFKLATKMGRRGPWEVDASGDDQGDDTGLAWFPHTDLGNAERMVRRFGWKMRHCHLRKQWLHFDGRRWAVDDTAAVRRMAREAARKILAEASTIEDDKARDSLVKWARATESLPRLNAMITIAAAESSIPILPADLNANPWLLNVLNGTIDLTTGKLRPHRRDDHITCLAPVEFDPRATCPHYDATLERFMAKDEDLIAFWDRLSGMALTADVSEQILAILFGVGDNGKSTLTGALLGLLGPDYAVIAPQNLLIAGRGQRHPTEQAYLFGKRLVIAMESEEGARLNESLIKQLTGSDPITARGMGENFWTFNPTHKLWMCTNHKPVIKGTDHAIWRRPKLVPFDVIIPEAEKNTNFPKLLKAEYPGILARCVRGCLDWQKGGLRVPSAVEDATAKYRKEQDQLGDFLADECTQSPELRAKAGATYQRYRQKLQHLGEEPMSLTKFGSAMKERGFEKTESGGIWYLGIGLNAVADPD